MSRPFLPRRSDSSSFVRVNGKIRAREVRVIDGETNQQLGVLSIGDALSLARQRGVDLVEVSANATPPVCKLINYGKFRYDQAKKEKESRKHQHANKVKEVQLSPSIDPHDLRIKLDHAVDFLCEDMKVKISLRFRGRENAHPEIGMQLVQKFIADLALWGHPDFAPKHSGKMINAMVSPLPRQKRARHPKESEGGPEPDAGHKASPSNPSKATPGAQPVVQHNPSTPPGGGFSHNPFASLKVG